MGKRTHRFSRKKKIKKLGFRAKMKSQKGKLVLKRRRQKGRRKLIP